MSELKVYQCSTINTKYQVAVACIQFVEMWATCMYAIYFTHFLLRTSEEIFAGLDRGWHEGGEHKRKIAIAQLSQTRKKSQKQLRKIQRLTHPMQLIN